MSVPLVYLPGSLCDERVFADQLRAVEHPSQVADLTRDDSFAAMTDRVLADAPEQFAIVALSMGCIVAAELAHVAPERVVGMALFDFNLAAPDEAQNTARRRWGTEVRAGRFDAVVDEILPAMTTAPEIHGPLVADMARVVGPTGFLNQNDALLDRYDRRPIVSGFTKPLLIGCGRHDQLCRPQLHLDLAATVPGASVFIAENAGHLATLEQPAELTSAISSWLKVCKNQTPRRGIQNEHCKA